MSSYEFTPAKIDPQKLDGTRKKEAMLAKWMFLTVLNILVLIVTSVGGYMYIESQFDKEALEEDVVLEDLGEEQLRKNIKDITAENVTLRQQVCSDSDAYLHGDDKFTEGTVTYYGNEGKEQVATDTCERNGGTVMEYFCTYDEDGSAKVDSEFIPCSFGCESGKCTQ